MTNYVAVNNRIINKSISVNHIENVTKTKITPVKVNVGNQVSLPGHNLATNTVSVFRPVVKLAPASAKSPAPHQVDRLYQMRKEALQSRQQVEQQQQLEQRQHQERQHAQVAPEVIRQQQAAERQAQQAQHARESHLLDQ